MVNSIYLLVFFSSETKKTLLPSASSILLNGTNNTGEVFNNPYKKAENDQIASLEKHVKMVRSNFLFVTLVKIKNSFNIKKEIFLQFCISCSVKCWAAKTKNVFFESLLINVCSLG